MQPAFARDVTPSNERLERLAARFVLASEHRSPPTFARVRFPDRLDQSRPVLPLTLLSLHGLPIYENLTEAQRWRLGLLETVNFFSLNIHGEQALVAELAQCLYRPRGVGESPILSRYLQHFIHEENSHTYMMAEFCTRYYGRVMPEIVCRFENPPLSRAGQDLLFYSRVFVLETFLDFVNQTAMKDREIDATARAVHRSHHLDESIHIAFDKAIIAMLCREMREQKLDAELSEVHRLTRAYAEYAISRLVNVRIYRELALPDPLALARQVQALPPWLKTKSRLLARQEADLRKCGLCA